MKRTMPAADTDLAEKPLCDELRSFQAQLDEALESARRVVWGLGDEALNWRPPDGGWSIGLCLDHLNVTYRQYLAQLEPRIEQAHAEETYGTGLPRRGWIGKQFLNLLEPPPRRKMRTPRQFQPAEQSNFAVEDLIGQFRTERLRLKRAVERANGLDLWRVKMSSPVFKLLRLSLGEIFAVLLAHDRRHLWQAEHVKERLPGELR